MPTSHVSGLGHATAPDFRQKNSNFLCFSFVIYFDFISADEDLIAGDSNHPIRAAGHKGLRYKGWHVNSEVHQLVMFPPIYFRRETGLVAYPRLKYLTPPLSVKIHLIFIIF